MLTTLTHAAVVLLSRDARSVVLCVKKDTLHRAYPPWGFPCVPIDEGTADPPGGGASFCLV